MLVVGLAMLLASGPVLWKNVEYGMTVEQLHQLYPEQAKLVKWLRYKTDLKSVLRVGSCTTTVTITHPDGLVLSIDVHGNYSVATGTHCADEALAGLISTYDAPTSQQTVKEDGWVNERHRLG